MKLRHAVSSPQTLSTRNKKGCEDESNLREDAIVEHEEACNAREIGRAEKMLPRRTKSSQRRRAYPEQRAVDVPRPRLRAIDALVWLEKACGTGEATLERDDPRRSSSSGHK